LSGHCCASVSPGPNRTYAKEMGLYNFANAAFFWHAAQQMGTELGTRIRVSAPPVKKIPTFMHFF